MRQGINLPFKLLGVPVKLDTSFLLVLPLFAYLIGSQIPALVTLLTQLGVVDPAAAGVPLAAGKSELEEGMTPWLLGLAGAVGLFTSVVIHELGHATVARLYGVETIEIRLWFLGGVAQFKEIPKQRGAEALVALAGPVTSAGLGLLLWVLVPVADFSLGVQVIVAYLAVTNIALAVFNLLPALPLDGGRILRSLLALGFDRLRATNIAVAISGVLAVAMGIYGFFTGQFFLVIMAFFVYNAGRAEAGAAYLDDAVGSLSVADLMTEEPLSVQSDMPLTQFARLGQFRRHAGYPVVDDGHLVGYAFLPSGAPEDGGATVADVMVAAETASPTEPALGALQRIAASATGRLMVVDAAGSLVGIVSKTDLIKVLGSAKRRQ